jgi:hypothetical protein
MARNVRSLAGTITFFTSRANDSHNVLNRPSISQICQDAAPCGTVTVSCPASGGEIHQTETFSSALSGIIPAWFLHENGRVDVFTFGLVPSRISLCYANEISTPTPRFAG